MKNTLSVYIISPGTLRTEFHYADGGRMWENNRTGLSETDVLVKLLQKKIYQNLPGTWEVLLPNDQKVFQDPDFNKVVQMVLRYIYERDNPVEPEYFC